MSTQHRGLFLDLDGTLADSLSMLRGVYRAFLAEFGVAGTEAEFQRLNGPPLRRVVEILQQTHRLPGTPAALFQLYMTLLSRAHGEVRPAAGAEAVLAQARAQGWRAALVTSTPHAAAEAWLSRNHLRDAFDLIIGGDDVARGKPDPEPYRRALALTGCDPALSLAVEDSVQGATAASGAEIPTWVLADPLPPALVGRPFIRGSLPAFVALSGLL